MSSPAPTDDGIVREGQLCEHLSPEQIADLIDKGCWGRCWLPTSLCGRPVSLERVEGGYILVYDAPRF